MLGVGGRNSDSSQSIKVTEFIQNYRVSSSPTTFVVAICDKPDEPLGVYYISALTPFLNDTETQSPVVPLKKRGRPRKQPLISRRIAGENAIMSAYTPPRRDGFRRYRRRC
ncbi:pro-Pol polyprotein [Trichonephila clavipes]|nr:pro-Pol polyprotein [Trichonephila clavipes]